MLTTSWLHSEGSAPDDEDETIIEADDEEPRLLYLITNPLPTGSSGSSSHLA